MKPIRQNQWQKDAWIDANESNRFKNGKILINTAQKSASVRPPHKLVKTSLTNVKNMYGAKVEQNIKFTQAKPEYDDSQRLRKLTPTKTCNSLLPKTSNTTLHLTSEDQMPHQQQPLKPVNQIIHQIPEIPVANVEVKYPKRYENFYQKERKDALRSAIERQRRKANQRRLQSVHQFYENSYGAHSKKQLNLQTESSSQDNIIKKSIHLQERPSTRQTFNPVLLKNDPVLVQDQTSIRKQRRRSASTHLEHQVIECQALQASNGMKRSNEYSRRLLTQLSRPHTQASQYERAPFITDQPQKDVSIKKAFDTKKLSDAAPIKDKLVDHVIPQRTRATQSSINKLQQRVGLNSLNGGKANNNKDLSQDQQSTSQAKNNNPTLTQNASFKRLCTEKSIGSKIKGRAGIAPCSSNPALLMNRSNPNLKDHLDKVKDDSSSQYNQFCKGPKQIQFLIL